MHVNVLGRARQALAPEYAGHSTPELNATECNSLNAMNRNGTMRDTKWGSLVKVKS